MLSVILFYFRLLIPSQSSVVHKIRRDYEKIFISRLTFIHIRRMIATVRRDTS